MSPSPSDALLRPVHTAAPPVPPLSADSAGHRTVAIQAALEAANVNTVNISTMQRDPESQEAPAGDPISTVRAQKLTVLQLECNPSGLSNTLCRPPLGHRLDDRRAFRLRRAQRPIPIHATPLARFKKADMRT